MIKVPYDDVIAKLIKESKLSENEINEKIEEKMSQLSGLVSKEGAAHIVANELGVKIADENVGRITVDKVLPGMRAFQLVGKVQRISDTRQFDTGKRKGQVRSFVVGDETGTIRVVAWNDLVEKIQTMKENDIISIDDAFVKENNGQKEIHMNDRTKIEINPVGEVVGDVKITRQQRDRKKIESLLETDNNVELLGTVVQVFEPRYFEVCPDCGKRTRPTPGGDFVCEAHGKIMPKYSYVMNAVVDDGTGTIRAVFFKNQAENLTGKSEDDFISIKDNSQKIEQMKTDVLGEIIKVVGRVSKNAVFDRLEFVSQLVFRNPDPEEELIKLTR